MVSTIENMVNQRIPKYNQDTYVPPLSPSQASSENTSKQGRKLAERQGLADCAL